MDNRDIYLKLGVVVAVVIALLYSQRSPSPTKTSDVRPILGIDLGSAYMSMAVWTDQGVSIIYNTNGRRNTPVVISFEKDGRIYIGDDAQAKALSNVKGTIHSIFSLLGKSWDNLNVQSFILSNFTAFTVVNSNRKPSLQLNVTTTYYPEELVATFLSYLVSTAIDQLGEDINKVVLTVPAYFNDHQRRAIKNAGKLAGLDVLKVLNAPTAVALYKSLNIDQLKSSQEIKEDKLLMVIDFGASHLDVSLVLLEDGIIEAVASKGTESVSGDKINKNLAKHFLKQLKRKHGGEPTHGKGVYIRFLKEIERVKRRLSTNLQATLEVENFSGSYDFTSTLTRDDFETINQKIWTDFTSTIQKLLKESRRRITEIYQVILTGGSSRIPKVEQILQKTFSAKKVIQEDPDMSVTYGAAVQGGILSHASSLNDKLVLDINTVSLGYKTVHGNISTQIPKYQSLPISKTVNFTTAKDFQTSMALPVYEGEDINSLDTKEWGQLIIDGIPPIYRKEFAMFEVTFEIDERGLYDFHMMNKSVEYEKLEIKPSVRGLKSLEIPGLKANVSRLVSEIWQNQKREKYVSKLEMCMNAIDWKLSNGNLVETQKKKLVTLRKKVKNWLNEKSVGTLLDLVSNALNMEKELSDIGLVICN